MRRTLRYVGQRRIDKEKNIYKNRAGCTTMLARSRSLTSNRDVNLSAHWLLLLSVVRLILEYGGEVWEDNKSQAVALESVMLGGAKPVLG